MSLNCTSSNHRPSHLGNIREHKLVRPWTAGISLHNKIDGHLTLQKKKLTGQRKIRPMVDHHSAWSATSTQYNTVFWDNTTQLISLPKYTIYGTCTKEKHERITMLTDLSMLWTNLNCMPPQLKPEWTTKKIPKMTWVLHQHWLSGFSQLENMHELAF